MAKGNTIYNIKADRSGFTYKLTGICINIVIVAITIGILALIIRGIAAIWGLGF